MLILIGSFGNASPIYRWVKLAQMLASAWGLQAQAALRPVFERGALQIRAEKSALDTGL